MHKEEVKKEVKKGDFFYFLLATACGPFVLTFVIVMVFVVKDVIDNWTRYYDCNKSLMIMWVISFAVPILFVIFTALKCCLCPPKERTGHK